MKYLLILPVAASCAALVFTARQHQKSVEAELAALKASLPSLVEKQAAQLQHEPRYVVNVPQANHEGPATAAQAKPVNSAEPPEERNEAPAAPLDETPAEAVARREETKARVELAFSSQARDASWSRGAATQIQSSLHAKLGSSRMGPVECRSTLCRVEVSHPAENDEEQFVTGAFAFPRVWQGEMLSIRQERDDGSRSSVLFFAREGQAFGVD